jgi:pyrroline-5-carboxylate reductase
MLQKKIVLIGGGNMGKALLRGILQAKLSSASSLVVVDVHQGKLEALHHDYGWR